MKRIARTLLLASMMAAAQVASALNYSSTDLLLIFHQTGYNDAEFDLGPVANFTGLAAGTVVPVAYDTNLVYSNFNNSFAGVKFGVVGASAVSDPTPRVWLTSTDTNSTPGDLTLNTYATLASKIDNVGLSATLITAADGNPLVIDPSDFNAYSYIVSPGDPGSVSSMGGDAPFTVSAEGPTDLALFQLIPTTNNPVPTAIKLGVFSMAANGAITFTAAAVTPVITKFTTPANVIARGGSATFTAAAEGATGFQWYRNGVAIAGATNAALTITNAQPGDVGSYTVAAINSSYTTSTTSPVATLSVTPAYSAGDLLLVFHDGSNPDVEFNLGSVSNYLNQGSGSVTPINYNKSLVLANFGSLSNVMASFVGASDSPLARVWLSDASLNPPPTDLTLNTYATLAAKVDGAGVMAGGIGFPLVVAPTEASSYSAIVSPGDLGSVGTFGGDAPFTVSLAFPSFAGLYELHPSTNSVPPAANFAGVLTLAANGDLSFTATTNPIGAVSAPLITAQPAPASQTVNQGAAITYTVTATNDFASGSFFAITYQWKLNGTDIVGATGSSHTDSDLQPGDIGSYTVVATSVGGSTTSSVATLALLLDGVGPTPVKITSPALNGFNTNGIVSGTAKDNVKVAKVYYGINGSPVTNLASFTGGSGTTTNWSFTGVFPAANNTVVVQAQDLAGNLSVFVTNTFFFGVYQPLTIVTNGEGAVAHNGPTTFGTVSSNQVSLVVGKPYKIKVTAAGNYLFSNIVDSASGVSTLTTYPFTMSTGLTLTVTFSTNRFFATAGSYVGLFSDTNNGVTFSNAGYFKAKVKATSNKLATATGTVYVEGNSKGFSKATFDLFGVSSVGVVDRSKWSKTNLLVRLVLPLDGSDTLGGTVSNEAGGWVSDITAYKEIAAGTYAGNYTMLVKGAATNSASEPGGDGYGLVGIDTNGVLKLTGKLADGDTFKQKTRLSPTGDWPLYSSGTKVAPGQNNSMVFGWLTVSATNITGTPVWLKVSGGTRYTNGIAVEPGVVGSPYFPSDPLTTNILAWPNALSNGVVTYEGAGIAAGILSNSVTLTNAAGKNKFITDKVNKMTLALTPKSGKLVVSFKNPPDGSLTAKGEGAILTNLNGGSGYFLPTSGQESGQFQLEPSN